MAERSCENCKWCRPLEKWDYTKVGLDEEWKEKQDGYACVVFDECVIWVRGGYGMCELWTSKNEVEEMVDLFCANKHVANRLKEQMR